MAYKINWHVVGFWKDTRDAFNVRVYDVGIQHVSIFLSILRLAKADLIVKFISVKLHVWAGTSAVSIDKVLNGLPFFFLLRMHFYLCISSVNDSCGFDVEA